ncbi:hypothetical protein F5Y19DRAFT_475726 [Xylariaceae sp. FL1651]|nr:hypothetical protein F5Y19DRAFT_475726 [Xylariaceae sp. FL1651]
MLSVWSASPLFPYPVPRNLVKLFVPEDKRNKVLEEPSNKDCLIRPLFRKRDETRTSGAPLLGRFSLRNYEMSLEALITLHLYLNIMAKSMGHATAVMHWYANMDGNDVEFILGSTPHHGQVIRHNIIPDNLKSTKMGTSIYERVTSRGTNFCRRTTKIDIEMMEMWKIFSGEYFNISNQILSGPKKPKDPEFSLPRIFITKIEERCV